jgi:hypothetical protein
MKTQAKNSSATASSRRPRRKTLQVRLAAPLYDQTKRAVDARADEFPSVNEFVVRAVMEKLRRLEEQAIDAAFSRMGTDDKYLRATADISRDFARSDWEAFKISEGE